MGDISQKKEYSVAEAKERLRAASGRFDPWGAIKARPLCSVLAAFVTGLGWSALWRSKLSSGLVPLSIQLLKRM